MFCSVLVVPWLLLSPGSGVRGVGKWIVKVHGQFVFLLLLLLLCKLSSSLVCWLPNYTFRLVEVPRLAEDPIFFECFG